jgi:heme-degrading monooxygenase HmoA
MIIEHAILDVKEGQGKAFEAALAAALPLIKATPGFISLEIKPCVENASRYLLLVEWQTLEAHTEGFRGSSRYPQWKALLHHFYDPLPTVQHYGAAVVKG